MTDENYIDRRRRPKVGNRPGEPAAPGCETCALRKTCEQAEEGTFCTRWRSRAPEVKTERDPNEAWVMGDDYWY